MRPGTSDALVFIVAGPLDQPTGGYRYDAHIIAGLRDLGWPIDIVELAGRFPIADSAAAVALDNALAACADGGQVVIDGLACGSLPAVVERHAPRLTIAALIHHPLCDETGLDAATAMALAESEARVLACVDRIITTSEYTRDRLRALGLADQDAAVVEPGVDTGCERARSRPAGPWRLLCVATLVPRKGHDVLVDAFTRLTDLDWHCHCLGADDRDPAHAARIEQAIAIAGLSERITLHGAVEESCLANHYAQADLFVLASHYEGYGMVVTEAIAHGLPVVTTTGGALARTLPAGAGRRVAPDDPAAFAGALRALMSDPAAFETAQSGVRRTRASLRVWPDAARAFSLALAPISAAGDSA